MAKIRVRARTVDLLGRQQISNIPTAIQELFKNAHDAYAEKVEVDYYRHDDLLVLRDDGFGMTLEDFESRWLTLGTESKLVKEGGTSTPYAAKIPSNKQRHVLGEKGIGRLSIASLGPQVLILTRAKFGKSPLVVASYIHWGMFEIPGLDLDQIEIPVKEVPEGALPNKVFVTGILKEALNGLKALKKDIPTSTYQRIRKDIENFEIDPVELDEILDGPSLANGNHGTQFFVSPADKIIQADIDEQTDNFSLPRLLSVLLGFSNTMAGSKEKPPVLAQFRDHHEDGVTNELIGPDTFFNPKEFELADHHFKGRFDANGNFKGEVSIYGNKAKVFESPWDGKRKKPNCGPFTINFAYLQGKPTQSKVPPDIHQNLLKKLDRSGGLYVYKDSIRVLPYGEPDYDFLQIEKRRTLGLGYYFFSHRRMFGVIDISSKRNPKLTEKAGREGFLENQAYRDFRDLMSNLLINLAGEYFRKDEKGNAYRRERENLEKKAKIRKEREQEATKVRNKLTKDLDGFFKNLNRGAHEQQAAKIRDEYSQVLGKVEVMPKSELTKAVIQIERRFETELEEFLDRFTVYLPEGVGINKSLRRDYRAYEEKHENLKIEYFDFLKKEFNSLAMKALTAGGKKSDSYERFYESLNKLGQQAKAKISNIASEAKNQSGSLNKMITTKSDSSRSEIENVVSGSIIQFKKLSGKNATHVKIGATHDKLKNSINNSLELELKNLQRIAQSIQDFNNTLTNTNYTSSELTEALEEKIEDLTEEIDESAELLHIGMALGIVQHEFLNTIDQVRRGIQKLRPWAKENPELLYLYKDIQSSFEHLSGYLKLFDPLSRRLNPSKITIEGEEIYIFLLDMFGEKFKRYDVRLKATDNFKKSEVTGYTSTFYPSFVNLVDNAVYWLSEYKESNRNITLDANRTGFVVRDNGPGVEQRYRERIFDFGFSRKTSGRGMGLYITKEALRREEHELKLLPTDEGSGASFQISLKRVNVNA